MYTSTKSGDAELKQNIMKYGMFHLLSLHNAGIVSVSI